jgi:outer membrane immunogenic protein
MNKLIVSSVALIASLAGSARAADMPIRPPAVVESWTGFYVGVALGGRFSDSTWTTNCLSAGAPGGVGCPLNFAANGPRFVTDNPSGFSSATFRPSVYLGYNWQVGNWVVGAEADVAYGQGNNTIKGIPGAENLAPNPGVQAGSPGNDSATIKDSWDASARARAGFLITPTMLLYATGGASWIHLEASAFCGTVNPLGWCRPGANLGTTSTASTTRIGWTAGGGIEAMLWSNWLARIEYRYSDYGKFDYTLFSGVDAIAAETKFHTHTALVGVAYRFGAP